MIKSGGGSVVNVGSMWAKQAIKATPSSAYSMAKAGLHALTQHMAMELADHNIRVNAVSPAVVKTPIYESFIKPEEVDQALEGFNAFHPIGRVGLPKDIANSISFLLSDSEGYAGDFTESEYGRIVHKWGEDDESASLQKLSPIQFSTIASTELPLL